MTYANEMATEGKPITPTLGTERAQRPICKPCRDRRRHTKVEWRSVRKIDRSVLGGPKVVCLKLPDDLELIEIGGVDLIERRVVGVAQIAVRRRLSILRSLLPAGCRKDPRQDDEREDCIPEL
jgi:hypothetical protein